TRAAPAGLPTRTDGEGPLEQRRTSGGEPATGGNGRWPWGAPDSQHPTRTPRAENSPRLGLTCRAGGVLRPLRRFLRWSSAAPAVPRRLGKKKAVPVGSNPIFRSFTARAGGGRRTSRRGSRQWTRTISSFRGT